VFGNFASDPDYFGSADLLWNFALRLDLLPESVEPPISIEPPPSRS
jgi:hypothetical protein